jgi:hypothetical protein
MRLRITYLFLLLALAGCVKETTWTSPGDAPRLLAVDAILTSERKTQVITINRPVSDLNDTAKPVNGATVLVHSADSTWNLTETPSGSGKYITPASFMALIGKTYTLNIFYDGAVYSAKASMVAGKTFDPLFYLPDAGGNLYHIDYVASAFSSSSPAMWEILLDWSAVPGYSGQDPSRCRARMLFYTLPTLDVSEIFAPVVEQVSFPAGTSITERRYSLSPAHAEFIRELLLETGWQGGLFPTQAANVSTNLSAGALGFFGVCDVTELSMIVH